VVAVRPNPAADAGFAGRDHERIELLASSPPVHSTDSGTTAQERKGLVVRARPGQLSQSCAQAGEGGVQRGGRRSILACGHRCSTSRSDVHRGGERSVGSNSARTRRNGVGCRHRWCSNHPSASTSTTSSGPIELLVRLVDQVTAMQWPAVQASQHGSQHPRALPPPRALARRASTAHLRRWSNSSTAAASTRTSSAEGLRRINWPSHALFNRAVDISQFERIRHVYDAHRIR